MWGGSKVCLATLGNVDGTTGVGGRPVLMQTVDINKCLMLIDSIK